MTKSIRVQAQEALLQGKHTQALALFTQLHEEKPNDMRIYGKLAELREKTKDIRGAVKAYTDIANAYADQGFVVQAIAINKILLRLDSTQTGVQRRLKDLSNERGEDWAVKTTGLRTGGNISNNRLTVERMPLFSGLSGNELQDFIDSLQLHSVPAKTYIYKEGDRGNYLYIVSMGCVALEASDKRGNAKVYARLLEGDFFGEDAFLARGTYRESAKAATDCSVLIIERSTFDEWVSKYPRMQSTVEDFYRKKVLTRALAIAPIFSGLPPNVINEALNLFICKTVQAGEAIVHEGEVGDSFYLIRSGRVAVFTSDMKNRDEKVPLTTLNDGHFFGEVALLSDKPRTATVVAISKVELMILTRAHFNTLLKKHPSMRTIAETYQKKRVQKTIKILLNRK